MSDLVQELRDYPAIDPRTAVFAVDPLPDGYCIVPRTSVLRAADEIERLRLTSTVAPPPQDQWPPQLSDDDRIEAAEACLSAERVGGK